jgi:hypothetical protein
MSYPTSQPPQWNDAASTVYPKKRKVWPWIVGGLVALVILGCGAGVLALGGAVKEGVKTVEVDASRSATGAPKQKAAVKAPAPARIGEGTWEVGTDVKPGKYKTSGAADSVMPMCYWDVRKGSETGEFKDQGLVDSATAQGRVTLKAGDFFKTSGCNNWTAVK